MTLYQNFEELAREALKSWGAEDADLSLIKQRENIVFAVKLTSGVKAALRIHRYGYHDEIALRSELQWMSYLSENGVVVPAPFPTSEGHLFTNASTAAVPESHMVDLLAWMDGEELGQSGEAFNRDSDSLRRIYFSLGETMARMHLLSNSWILPSDFKRHSWDLDGLIGEQPFWGRFWELEELADYQRSVIVSARDKARLELASYQGSYGLIHADLIRENVMVSRDGLQLIDFDDAGFGWHLFDVATALHPNRNEPDFNAIETSLLTGYSSVKPLTTADHEALPLFMLLRRFTYLGWAQDRRGEPGMTERTLRFIDNVMPLAEQFLGLEAG
jgi:Ser/Thr protein kinase RdoA (MazF antagonist)